MTILIVDDEAPARKKIRSFLLEEDGATVILEAENGEEATAMILKQHPELVFLDIQMPRVTGFEVIEAVGASAMPPVVFCTAFEQFALDAFEVQAIDYLLKPFDQERFKKAFQRAMTQIQLRQQQQGMLTKLLDEIKKKGSYLRQLMVKEGQRIFFVNVDEIYYITSEEKYVELHVDKRRYLIRETMSNLETRLNPDKFVRTHRTTLLNLDFLQEIQPWSHGDCIALLKNGEKLNVSRRYRDRLLKQ